MLNKTNWSLIIFFELCFFISGCAVTTTQLSDAEQEVLSVDMKGALIGDHQEPVFGEIDLYEAIARALKYNLDVKAKTAYRLETLRKAGLAKYSQWPELAVQGGYSNRSNDSGGRSQSIRTGLESLESSTSSERELSDGAIQFSWSILDFGLSYVRATQAANQVMIAREEERKVANQLVGEVMTAYWRTVTADRLLPRLISLRNDVAQALTDLDDVVSKKLQNPVETLRYKRELLDIDRRLNQLIDELTLARIRLASLMNLKPGTEYRLATKNSYRSFYLDAEIESLERMALALRPETRSLGYESRIAAAEGKAAMLELMPSLKLYAGTYQNSNDLLENQSWEDAGAAISWNLFNVFRYPATSRFVAAHKETLRAQQLSLTMAVLAQLHSALAKFQNVTTDFEASNEYFKTQKEIIQHISSAYRLGRVTQQTYLYEQLNTLLSEVERDAAYVEMASGFSDVILSVGLDLLPEKFSEAGLDKITDELRGHWGFLEAYNFALKGITKNDGFFQKNESSSVESASDTFTYSMRSVDESLDAPATDDAAIDEDKLFDSNGVNIIGGDDEATLGELDNSSTISSYAPESKNHEYLGDVGYTVQLAAYARLETAMEFAKTVADSEVALDQRLYVVVYGRYSSVLTALHDGRARFSDPTIWVRNVSLLKKIDYAK